MKKRIIVASVLASAMLITSCENLTKVRDFGDESYSTEETVEVADTAVTAVTSEAVVTEAAASETVPAQPSETSISETTSETSDETSETSGDVQGDPLDAAARSTFFRTYEDTYLMSSGAGGWSAYVVVNYNGTFDYNYHDFDAGSYYICHASGELGNVAMIDEHTYVMTVISMTYEYEVDSEWTETDTDGVEISYIASDSYGFHEGDQLYFYVAGAQTETLPEGYVFWYCMPRALNVEDVPDPFPLNGIYNVVDDTAYIEDDYE